VAYPLSRNFAELDLVFGGGEADEETLCADEPTENNVCFFGGSFSQEFGEG
jgi:hypothetical protein